MKKSLLAFLFSLYFVNANSQDILDIVGNEVCSCAASKVDELKAQESSKVQLELGFCIVASYSAHKEAVIQKYGDVLQSDTSMKQLGMDVGLKMASICPDVLLKLAESGFGSEDEQEEEALTLEGKIVEIKPEQFLTVIVKDNSGRSHSMMVLTFFKDSNLLTDMILKKNDKVSVDYWEQEFYDTKAKDFRYYKVIQGIKKI